MDNPTHNDDFSKRLKAARASRKKDGQRRIVTILFCDVTGSTEMAGQLDAEDWAEIMDDAFDFLIEPVQRYGGTVARLMGDGLLAFFGAPIAHEDDPQRAVLAGLEIVKDIQLYAKQIKREYGLNFNVRVGINTGPVVVQEIGSEFASEYTAMGDAINLAARMEQTAQPGTIQISENTCKLVSALFECEPLGKVQVKGKGEPVESYRVVGRRARPGRVRGIQGVSSPLVGRESALSRMQTIFGEVENDRGHIITLIGEAGIGKSRLIEEFQKKWADHWGEGNSVWIETRGITYESSRPYSVFSRAMRSSMGIQDGDPRPVVREKITALTQDQPPDRQEVFRRATEIMLDVEEEARRHPIEGEALKRELYEANRALLKLTASRFPTVMMIDDLHWADSSSIEMLQYLFRLAEATPLVFLIATRPDRKSPGWQIMQLAEENFNHCYTNIPLDPLTQDEIVRLIENLLSIPTLPANIGKMIVQKADGNPLFVEEVIRVLIEGGDLTFDANGLAWNEQDKVNEISIPDNLRVLLNARIDRLEKDERQTLQLASVIGRSFYYKILHAVSDQKYLLSQQLVQLSQLELILKSASNPELTYMFRHELTRDAAYSSILRRQRRLFHLQVGEAFEKIFPDRLDEEATFLAYHFGHGGNLTQAIKYDKASGDTAVRLHANVEATEHYTRAIEHALKIDFPSGQLIDLYSRKGRAFEVSARYDEALITYEELESLARKRDDRALELAALTLFATVYSTLNVKFNPDLGREYSEKALEMARTLGDKRAEAKVLWVRMLLSTYIGEDQHIAVEYGEKSLAIAQEYNFIEETAYALHDLVRPYAAVGRNDEAMNALAEAGKRWRELENLPMLADNLSTFAGAHYYQGRFDEGIAAAREGLHVSESIGSYWGQAYAHVTLAPLYFERAEYGKAIATWEAALELSLKANFTGPHVFSHTLLGHAYGMLGDLEKGHEMVALGAEKAQELDPKQLRYYAMTAQASLAWFAGDLEEAEQISNEILENLDSMSPDPPTRGMVIATSLEIALSKGNYEYVLSTAEETLQWMRDFQIGPNVALLLYCKARALFGLGRADEGYAVLLEAKADAEEIKARMVLWQVLASISEIETEKGNMKTAASLLAEAKKVIAFIANNTGSEALKNSFLSQPKVRAVLDT